MAVIDSPRRNRTYYSGDLRRDLLDAALAVVASDGPAAVNLRALARELGVSHAAPANHFVDKTAVFTAIAQEGFELLGQAMTEALAAVPAEEPGRARVGATGQAYLRFALEHRSHFEVMWRTDLCRRDEPALQTAADATFDQLLDAVRAGQADGWATGADERSVAYLAWSAVHGLAVLWLNGPLQGLDDRSFDQLASAVGALLNDSLAAYVAPHSEGHSHD
jgi:AcrR family transcriptional regulator